MLSSTTRTSTALTPPGASRFRLAWDGGSVRGGFPTVPFRMRDPLRVSSAREHREEGAALARRALDADGASLSLDDALRERESQPGPRILLRLARIELLELGEELADLFGPDADAGVLDLQTELARRRGTRADRDPPAFGRELDRVRDVVVENLLQLGRVRDHRVESGFD